MSRKAIDYACLDNSGSDLRYLALASADRIGRTDRHEGHRSKYASVVLRGPACVAEPIEEWSVLDQESQQLGLPVSRTLGVAAPPSVRRELPTVGLFSGVGGLELGLARAGHQSLLVCEVDQAASTVLNRRFPEVRLHDDVCTINALPTDTKLVAGGFPCQDLSQAGQTRGIEGTRSGLVGQVFRLIEKQRVPWLLLENVPFMLQLSKGRALDVIVTALEQLGYHWAYRVVNSRAFGLPQRRRRVLIVASQEGDPRQVLFADEAGPPEPLDREGRACGFYWTEGVRGLGWAIDAVPTLKGGSTVGVPSPPAIWMPDGSFVTPDIRDAERLQGFVADWTAPAKAVRESLRWKLVGNAVSVPVARWVGERLASPGAFEVRDVRPVQPGRAWPTNAWNVGDGRLTCDISEWPKRHKRRPLTDFLKYEPKLLSERAMAGFLKRTRQGSLNFPDGFLAAAERHLAKMQA